MKVKQYCFLIFTFKKEFALYEVSLTLEKREPTLLVFTTSSCPYIFIRSGNKFNYNQDVEKEMND